MVGVSNSYVYKCHNKFKFTLKNVFMFGLS